jgi:rubrerythrin
MGVLAGLKEWLQGGQRGRHGILSDLIAAYEDELRAAAQLRAHAERVPYPQAAAALRQLADAEDRHAQALSEQIRVLGGSLRSVVPTIYEGLSHWERMAEDFRMADNKRRRYLQQAVHWEVEYPREAELLTRIAAEESANRRLLEDLASKADSLARD